MKGALEGGETWYGDACGASWSEWRLRGTRHVGNAWGSMVCGDVAISTKTTIIVYTTTLLPSL